MMVTGVGTTSNKGSGNTAVSGKRAADMALPFRINSAMPAQRVRPPSKKKKSVFKREKVAREFMPHYLRKNQLKLEQPQGSTATREGGGPSTLRRDESEE